MNGKLGNLGAQYIGRPTVFKKRELEKAEAEKAREGGKNRKGKEQNGKECFEGEEVGRKEGR